MKHLLPYFEARDTGVLNKVLISDTPQHALGLCFVKHVRLFLFKSVPSSLHIDFIAQNATEAQVYIVPPMHAHLIDPKETCSFVCIDVPEKLLTEKDKRILYAIKYAEQKTLPVKNMDVFLLLQSLTGGNTIAQFGYDVLTEHLKPNLILPEFPRPINTGYLLVAEKLLDFLKSKELRLDTCVIEYAAKVINCSARMLHRSCISVFGRPAKDILKHHMLLKAIYLLSRQRNSVSAVANDLGFSSVSAFDKYVKRLTKSTPRTIQHKLFALSH